MFLNDYFLCFTYSFSIILFGSFFMLICRDCMLNSVQGRMDNEKGMFFQDYRQ
jgi:hypothetical protein